MHPDDRYEQQRARTVPPPVPPGERDYGALWRYFRRGKDGGWVLADDRLRYHYRDACAHGAKIERGLAHGWRCADCGTHFLTPALLLQQRRDNRRLHDALRSKGRLQPLRVNWPLLWGHVGVETFERMLAAGWDKAARAHADPDEFRRRMK